MIGIIIPALDPPETFFDFVSELHFRTTGPIVIVNDSFSRLSVFHSLENLKSVTVLHHKTNRGKGEALKTGFCHLLADRTLTSVITVDADGQHLVEDVVRLIGIANSEPEKLILGVRDFETNVPFRSAFGNKITRIALKMITGLQLRDSQTGLRVLPRNLVEQSFNISSGGYAFELEVLFLAKKMNMNIKEVAITTVYIDRNRASHFRPIRDSFNVYLVFLRFLLVSLVSFFIDFIFFALLHFFIGNILVSTYIARVSSGVFNFFGNRSFVFHDRKNRSFFSPVIAYVVLAFLIATMSGVIVQILSEWFHWMPIIVKLCVDPCLFLLSFFSQRHIIFKRFS